jgi:outer membrane immunogenic protein
MKKTVAALLCGVVLAPAAFAQEADAPKYYWWAGYGTGEFDQDFAGDTARLGALQGKLGWRFHPNFAIEVEAAFGVDEDDINAGTLLLNHQFGGFGVAYLPLLDTVEVFGRAGAVEVQTESDLWAGIRHDKSGGVGYGLGAIWYVGPLDVRFEYTHYQVNNDAAAYMISLGSRF